MTGRPGTAPAAGAGASSGVLAAIPAGYKFVFLFLAGIGVYLLSDLVVQVVVFAVAVLAVLLTRVPALALLRMTSGLLVITGIVFVTTGVKTSWAAATTACLRLLTLCLFAYAISLTTRFSEMLALFEAALRPTRRIGLNPEQMSLALAMTVRFIPEIRNKYLEIREAQFARGLRNSPVAVVVPLIVRTLEAAQEISAAIDARCYDTEPRADGRAVR
ncbi:energy-coupling factor transporter transmembrane protein EcfT [Dactylosporangium roseum]|uniref:Energy-coupling factor transporter transmembrane protein EcfT n=1 Tax=Dactylosporangium roseum TaxID=47989 RepID=A0ABY5YZ92_9ACTN|nr:energy-coupling factor transporter transmembrane component T [Dactylosporangium roseum]UWZ34696.1 energy-coupling factor transporter transmembrane protein EcfT [Dactylosporangium roseum]